MVLKTKEKSKSMDSRNYGRGVVSEWFYEESKFFKDKNTCIPR